VEVRIKPPKYGKFKYVKSFVLNWSKVWRYREGQEEANAADDHFATTFYLERILSFPDQRTTNQFMERNVASKNPLILARTGLHHDLLAVSTYDRAAVVELAESGNRLAKRILAQQLLRDGLPELAIPSLNDLPHGRPHNAPPVEELLLAQAHLALKDLDKAKFYYQAAVAWLDQSQANDPLAERIKFEKTLYPVPKPLDDPRFNPVDWESWHECGVFRAELEKSLPPSIRKTTTPP
jgi:tetratricopeptide (TPR) repeat protein